MTPDHVQGANANGAGGAENGELSQLAYYNVRRGNFFLDIPEASRPLILFTTEPLWFTTEPIWISVLNPCGRRGGLLQGSFNEVSLALVGVASPAYFQY